MNTISATNLTFQDGHAEKFKHTFSNAKVSQMNMQMKIDEIRVALDRHSEYGQG